MTSNAILSYATIQRSFRNPYIPHSFPRSESFLTTYDLLLRNCQLAKPISCQSANSFFKIYANFLESIVLKVVATRPESSQDATLT